MAKTGVADALKRRLEATANAATATTVSTAEQAAIVRPVARTRAGKKFITFPVSDEAKQQFDILAAETRQRREELMREALRDLFAKYRKPPIA
jgi:predicted transcriptional regulator